LFTFQSLDILEITKCSVFSLLPFPAPYTGVRPWGDSWPAKWPWRAKTGPHGDSCGGHTSLTPERLPRRRRRLPTPPPRRRSSQAEWSSPSHSKPSPLSLIHYKWDPKPSLHAFAAVPLFAARHYSGELELSVEWPPPPRIV